MFKQIAKFIGKIFPTPGIRKQSCWVYCQCGNEMVGDEKEGENISFIRDVYVNELNVVHYNCSKCKKDSYFNFDFPAPIALPLGNNDNTIEEYNKIYSI